MKIKVKSHDRPTHARVQNKKHGIVLAFYS